MNHFFVAAVVTAVSSGAVLTEMQRNWIPNSGSGGAENVAFCNNQLFTADGYNLGINIIGIFVASSSTISSIELDYKDTILFSWMDFLDFGFENNTIQDVTSVHCAGSFPGILFATIVPDEYWNEFGFLAIIDPPSRDLTNLIELTDCFLPDHVTTTKDGDYVIISCEGEPDDNESESPTYNPPGSIAIVNISNISSPSVINIGFEDFNIGGSKASLLPSDIYLPHSQASVAENIEPEYTSCDYESKYCYISLQENNAVAILDLDEMEIISIHTLGNKDYSKYPLDASDKDGMINIKTYNGLYGLRMPDNIKYFQSKSGREYFVTANEGDGKGFDESRVGDDDIILDETVFGNVTMLKANKALGRLKIINQMGYTDVSGTKVYNKLYGLSSRDFSIFEVKNTDSTPTIEEVYSSDSKFANVTAEQLGEPGFNSNTDNPTFDERSDDKGCEPEAITVGECENGRIYVFIALERVGGIMVFDATYIDYGEVEFVEYVNNQNFSVQFSWPTRPPEDAGDIAPEQILFIEERIYSAEPILIVASSESASVTAYTVDCGTDPSFPTTTMDDTMTTTMMMEDMMSTTMMDDMKTTDDDIEAANTISLIGAMLMIIVSMALV